MLSRHIHPRRWPGWEITVGIEVHAQIKSRRKLFSDSWTSVPGDPPNTRVSPYDASFPGTLPRLNPKCVDLALRAAMALNSRIQLESSFDRKHYFYSDLPAGYQITQRYSPIALGGQLKLSNRDVRIKQIQLEQDTAKSTFDSRRRVSYIDLNRAGSGLMEIVSEPDMHSPQEAADYVRTLQSLLRAVGSSDGNMEQGSLRCDVNVSVARHKQPPGTRCEIKNLNSVKSVMIAITSEVYRQTALLDSGLPVAQETRGFDEQRGETFKLRSKEDTPDYRYMPDPNLPPLLLTEAYIHHVRQNMPELPDATRARLKTDYGLSARDVEVLMSGRDVKFDGELGRGEVDYFEDLCENGRDPKVVANWLIHGLMGQLAVRKESFRDNPLSVEQLGELIDMVQSGTITGTSGKALLQHMLANRSPVMPSEVAERLQLFALPSSTSSAVSPTTELETLCLAAMSALPDETIAMRKGNKNVVNKLVGWVMKKNRGRADAKAAKEVLERINSA